MSALLIVRAEVAEADRAAFDRWYEAEHLPQAKAVFGARSARRGWSDDAPGVHFAIYEFESLARAREVIGSEAMKAMVAEFDRAWSDRVQRRREVIDVAQAI